MRRRQQFLLDEVLPRLTFPRASSGTPLSAFGPVVRSLWVEVGSGAGEHAVAQTGAYRHAGLIACETYVNGLCALLSRLVPAGSEAAPLLPANLRIWPGDGRQLLRGLPNASVSRLFLLFPDPWPKTRHIKRRFVHPALLPELARVLVQGAEWRVATDDPVYQAWIAEVMENQVWFAAPPPLTARPADWPVTRYEAKALAAGRRPLYWCFIRR